MKIIAPTDFSDLSKSALIYAAQFAESTNSPLVLVYNAIFEGPPRATVLINLEEKIEMNAIEDMKQLAEWLKNAVQPSPDIFIEITKNHNAADAILKRTRDIDGGMIILSTRGASGLSSSILGSVSSEVLRKSSIPVLALPPGMESKNEGGFLFAIDPGNGLHEVSLRKYFGFCKIMNKNPQFLFVTTEDKSNEIAALKSYISQTYPEFTCEYHVVTNDNIVDCIADFTNTHNFSMLAIAPKKHNFFERMFGKSITTKLLAQLKIPVLSLTDESID